MLLGSNPLQNLYIHTMHISNRHAHNVSIAFWPKRGLKSDYKISLGEHATTPPKLCMLTVCISYHPQCCCTTPKELPPALD